MRPSQSHSNSASQAGPAAQATSRGGKRIGSAVVVLASGADAGESYPIVNGQWPIEEGQCPDPQIQIHRTKQGWTVSRNDSGYFFVGQKMVKGTCPLRSGDLIRLSHNGPDLQFRIQIDPASIDNLFDQHLPTVRSDWSTACSGKFDVQSPSRAETPPAIATTDSPRKTPQITAAQVTERSAAKPLRMKVDHANKEKSHAKPRSAAVRATQVIGGQGFAMPDDAESFSADQLVDADDLLSRQPPASAWTSASNWSSAFKKDGRLNVPLLAFVIAGVGIIGLLVCVVVVLLVAMWLRGS